MCSSASAAWPVMPGRRALIQARSGAGLDGRSRNLCEHVHERARAEQGAAERRPASCCNPASASAMRARARGPVVAGAPAAHAGSQAGPGGHRQGGGGPRAVWVYEGLGDGGWAGAAPRLGDSEKNRTDLHKQATRRALPRLAGVCMAVEAGPGQQAYYATCMRPASFRC